jgi:nucleoid-associated protein YgaU
MSDKKTPSPLPAWAQASTAKTPATPPQPATSAPAAAQKPAAPAAPAAKPATPATPAGENPYTQWYEVQKGDTLWKIAKHHYGDGSLYTEIFKANQDTLTDPDKIKPGQKLRIP